jgi:hypothetical protein
VNAAGPGGGNAGTPLFPLFGNANTISDQIPFKGGSYNSLQTRLTRQMGAGSQIGAVYTYSKAIDFFDNENNGLTWAWEPMWNRNKALAGYDRKHNFQFYAVYDLPFGHGKRWAAQGLAATILGDWSVNSILLAIRKPPTNSFLRSRFSEATAPTRPTSIRMHSRRSRPCALAQPEEILSAVRVSSIWTPACTAISE